MKAPFSVTPFCGKARAAFNRICRFRLQAEETLTSAHRRHILSANIWRPKNELKRGSAELMILAVLEGAARHGYEIGKLIDDRSDGVLRFHIASLYPMLYRMERRGWIDGKWIEKAGQRRRRYYRLTPAGRKVLAEQRSNWHELLTALHRVAGIDPIG